MTDQNPPERQHEPHLALHRILREGAEAAARIARDILRSLLETGRIDVDGVERLGPDVRRRLFTLMAERLLPPPAGQPPNANSPAAPAPWPAVQTAPPPVAPPAGPPRIDRHWRDQRRPAPDYRRDAFWRGWMLALSLVLLAYFSLAYLKF